jgi:hypothetical protein
MGWMCSWVAVKADKAAVLDALEFVETGEESEPGSRAAPFCVAERPGGWTVVFSEDFEWGDPGRVTELSRLGLAVGCQFEDKVEMTSVACAAEAGVELWSVFHNADPIDRLDVTGAPPPEFARSAIEGSRSRRPRAERAAAATTCTRSRWSWPRRSAATGRTRTESRSTSFGRRVSLRRRGSAPAGRLVGAGCRGCSAAERGPRPAWLAPH